ncbi:3288_t:CDS:2, partial [Ambispora leptoticha]
LLNSSADEGTTMVENTTMMDMSNINSSIIPGSMEYILLNPLDNSLSSIHHRSSNFALNDDASTLLPPLSPISSHGTIRSSSPASSYITADESFSPMNQYSFDVTDDENTLIDDRDEENDCSLAKEPQLSTPMQRVEVATRGGHKIITDVKLDVQQIQ